MKTRRRNLQKRFLCRVGLSFLLTMPAESPLLSNLLSAAHADEARDPPVHAQPEPVAVAALDGGRGCEAVPPGIEMAPELLALASWPLDESQPSDQCTGGPGPIAAAESELAPLPPAVEISVSPVVRVVAAGAEPEIPEAGPQAEKVAIVPPEELDDIRGGFELPDLGLKFSFGIERAVFVNGELVASTVLNVANLQQAVGGNISVTPVTTNPGTTAPTGGGNTVPPGSTNPVPPQTPAGGSTPPATVPGTVVLPPNVVQNGLGNGISVQFGPDLASTIVQNSLNDQHIKTITTITGTINANQLLRAMNLQSTILDGVIGSLRR